MTWDTPSASRASSIARPIKPYEDTVPESVKRLVRGEVPPEPLRPVSIEQLLPGCGMDFGGSRDNAVEAEDDGVKAGCAMVTTVSQAGFM